MIKNIIGVLGLAFIFITCSAETSCDSPPSSDDIQQKAQEVLLKQGTDQTGMPAMVNFRERKEMKDLLELRDQDGLLTYTYTFNEMTGKPVFFCESIGYPIPYATQYTNPQKIGYSSANVGVATLPQADPNGLFSPASAEGTWIMCADPKGGKARPVYVEPRVITSPFKLGN